MYGIFYYFHICMATSSQSELRLPLLQVVSSNKYFSVGVQSPTEINAPRGCAVILKRRCQLALTRITHQVSRAFDLNIHAIFFSMHFIVLYHPYQYHIYRSSCCNTDQCRKMTFCFFPLIDKNNDKKCCHTEVNALHIKRQQLT